MKKKEAPRSMPAIQLLDAAGAISRYSGSSGMLLPRCVGKIAEQRETQIRIRISEIANLEAIQLVRIASGVVSNIGTTTSVRQSSGMPSFLKDIFGNTCGGKSRGHEIIHDLHREVTRGQAEAGGRAAPSVHAGAERRNEEQRRRPRSRPSARRRLPK